MTDTQQLWSARAINSSLSRCFSRRPMRCRTVKSCFRTERAKVSREDHVASIQTCHNKLQPSVLCVASLPDLCWLSVVFHCWSHCKACGKKTLKIFLFSSMSLRGGNIDVNPRVIGVFGTEHAGLGRTHLEGLPWLEGYSLSTGKQRWLCRSLESLAARCVGRQPKLPLTQDLPT